MKKCFPVLIIMLLVFLVVPGTAQAESEWRINLNGDQSIKEVVTLDQAGTQAEYPGWKSSRQGDKLVLTRSSKDAKVYNQQADRLPVVIMAKDYILWKTMEVHSIANSASGGISELLMNQPQGIRFVVQASGFIGKNSADRVEDGTTAVWQLQSPHNLYNNERLLAKATVMDGFMVGIALFLLAFIVIAILFVRKVSKTHKLIEEEYSLENLQTESPDDDEEDSENK